MSLKNKLKNKAQSKTFFFENSKGFFVYDVILHRGRAFFKSGKVIDITRKTHPKMISSIKRLGKIKPCV